MTFSIAARDGDAWGVAVASKFLAVGSVVPAVRRGVGAVATQSLARVAYLDEVLDALAAGAEVGAALACRGRRRRGTRPAPGRCGRAHGRRHLHRRAAASPGPAGSPRATTHTAYAIQGNILTGPEVVEAMEAAWLGNGGPAARPPPDRHGARPGTPLEATPAAGRARRSSRSRRAPATTGAACSPTCASTTTRTRRASWPGCTTCRRCSSGGPRTSSRCEGALRDEVAGPARRRWGAAAPDVEARPRRLDVAGEPRDAALPRRHRRPGAHRAARRGAVRSSRA